MPIVLETREDRNIWYTYAAKLRNLSAHSYRNKFWKENRMDEWHAEYKMIEQERNKLLHDIQHERHVREKIIEEQNKKETELKRKEAEQKRMEASIKRRETINNRKNMEPVRRSTRLQKNTEV